MATTVELQRSQLLRARDEFGHAAEQILQQIGMVSGEIDGILGGISRLLDGDDRSGRSFLQGLHHNVASILGAVQQATERNREISTTLGASAQTTSEITAFVEGIDEIGSELELIAINAIVKASRTGTEGRPLTVIAREIQRQSLGARRVSTQVSERLKQIGGQANELELLARAFVAETQDSAAQGVTELEALLQGLARIDGQFREEMIRLRVAGARLGADLACLPELMVAHKELEVLVDEVSGPLSELAREARVWASADENGGTGPELDELARGYTMEAEREVHRELVGTDPGSPPQDGSPVKPVWQDSIGQTLGSNVELF